MEHEEFVKLDTAMSQYIRIIDKAPEERKRLEAKAVLNTDVEGADILYNLIQFFRGYRHLFSVGKMLIPKPDASMDVMVHILEIWERGKHSPSSAAGYVEAWLQVRDAETVTQFIQFLKEGDGPGGASVEGAIHSSTSEKLEQRFRHWKQRKQR